MSQAGSKSGTNCLRRESTGRATARTRLRLFAATMFVVIVCLGSVASLLVKNVHAVSSGRAYRSAQPSAHSLDRFAREYGIRTIVNLRGPWAGKRWYEDEHAAGKRLGIAVHDINLCSHNLAPMDELRRLVAVFDTCERPILMHCRRGADRTSLASALYLVLCEDADLDSAMQQYRLVYGHTGWAWGNHLPHVFDCYRGWLVHHGRAHSSATFREWIATEQYAWIFGAQLTLEPFGEPLRTNKATPVKCTALNVSRYAWTLTSPCQKGIHLKVTIREAPNGEETVLRIGDRVGNVAPGEHAVFAFVIPPIPRAGRYLLDAELVDSEDVRFDIMGSGKCHRELEVIADATMAKASHAATVH